MRQRLNVLVDGGHQRRLWHRANDGVALDAVPEDHDGGDGADAVLGGDAGRLVGVQLHLRAARARVGSGRVQLRGAWRPPRAQDILQRRSAARAARRVQRPAAAGRRRGAARRGSEARPLPAPAVLPAVGSLCLGFACQRSSDEAACRAALTHRLDLAAVLRGQLVDQGGDHAARAAPVARRGRVSLLRQRARATACASAHQGAQKSTSTGTGLFSTWLAREKGARGRVGCASAPALLCRNVQCSACAQMRGMCDRSAAQLPALCVPRPRRWRRSRRWLRAAARERASAGSKSVQRGLRGTAGAAQNAAARAHARTGGGRSGHQARAARRSGARRGGPEASLPSTGSLRPHAHRGDARVAQRRGHRG